MATAGPALSRTARGVAGPIVEVAVGVLIRPDGAVLFGQRPAGKPYAGWWEFPGGKLEPGESVEQALVRELHEELGIRVSESRPWVVREHVYPHAHVRLHFQRIVSWSGEPQAHEGQALAWRHPSAIDLAPLLPAAIPVIGWLRLPDRIGISCAAGIGVERLLERLRGRLVQGLRAVQLREPAMEPARFDALFREVRRLCARHGARLIVNSGHPESYWHACDGVHLRSRDLRSIVSRPGLPVVGASCHDAHELALAGELGVDFALLGPVKATPSHPGAGGLGWSVFERLVRASRVPGLVAPTGGKRKAA
ncbi:MAG: Nudix family hydrolase [Burkholderiales bacterium]|nr:MAG: Nudix family hydrolase [Burkholderiales bacterium]